MDRKQLKRMGVFTLMIISGVVIAVIFYQKRHIHHKPEAREILLEIGDYKVYTDQFIRKREAGNNRSSTELLDLYISAGLLYNYAMAQNYITNGDLPEKIAEAGNELAIDMVRENRLRDLCPAYTLLDYTYWVSYYFISDKAKYSRQDLLKMFGSRNWIREGISSGLIVGLTREVSANIIPPGLLKVIRKLSIGEWGIYESATGFHVIHLLKKTERDKGLAGNAGKIDPSGCFGWDYALLNEAYVYSKISVDREALGEINFNIAPKSADTYEQVVCELCNKRCDIRDIIDKIKKLPLDIRKIHIHKVTRDKITVTLTILGRGAENLEKKIADIGNGLDICKRAIIEEYIRELIKVVHDRDSVVHLTSDWLSRLVKDSVYAGNKMKQMMKRPDMQLLALYAKDEVKKQYYPWFNPEVFKIIKIQRMKGMDYLSGMKDTVNDHNIAAFSGRNTITAGEIRGVTDSLTAETWQKLIDKENMVVLVNYCFHKKYPEKTGKINFNTEQIRAMTYALMDNLFDKPDSPKNIARLGTEKYSSAWLKQKFRYRSDFKDFRDDPQILTRIVKKVIMEDYFIRNIRKGRLLDSTSFRSKRDELLYHIVVNELYRKVKEPYGNMSFDDDELNRVWQKSVNLYYTDQLNTMIAERQKKDKIKLYSTQAGKLGIDINASEFDVKVVR
jgi:hypothetical protein